MRFTLQSKENDERPVFITGNFNKWNPRDLALRLTEISKNTYFIEIEDEKLPALIEYKFTRWLGKC